MNPSATTNRHRTSHEEAWGECRRASSGEWFGWPYILRTPKGWSVRQLRWWNTKSHGKVGIVAVRRWFPDESKAEAFARRLESR